MLRNRSAHRRGAARLRGFGPVLGSLAVLAVSCAPGTSPTSQSTTPPLPPAANASAGPVGPLKAAGGRFLEDRYGRVVLMQGANLVYKVPPYEVVVDGSGTNTLTTDEARTMAALGFDVVRLGIIWKGLEPGTASRDNGQICRRGTPDPAGPHQFDAAVFDGYLRKLDATIALLGQYGISSLIDMHQDVYSEVFGGEGAPEWAVCTGGAQPQPKLDVPDWSVNLRGPGVVTAYDHFWNNDVVGNLQGEFDDVWARVASHFKTNPWVIGYDPYNEPYGQGVPPLASGAAFDAKLQCFYAGRAMPGTSQSHQAISCPPDDPSLGVIARIEGADPNHLVFYEGNYATDSGPLNHIGPMPFPRLVLNLHDYCFLHVPNGPEPPDFASICGPLEDTVFTQHAGQATRDATTGEPGGIPSFLSEFGATTDASDLARITADADAHLVGWTYWQWLLYDDPTGTHSAGLWPASPATTAMLGVLARTHATAVAGTPLTTSFDPPSGNFTLRYRSDPHITQPTVVFVPVGRHYPNGYCVAAPGARVTSASGAGTVDIEGPAAAQLVTVTISPGACPASAAA